MSSISVPIEKYRSYHDSYHDNSRHYGGSTGGPGDNGPPYIVKLLNLPVTSDDSFVVDLFESRYTPFVKFKIVVDPVSSPLETHVIKKVAFVELTNYQDMTKVLKWMDLYYKGSRRVVIEPADFADFQHCISYNQQHEQELFQLLDDFIAGRVHERQANHHQDRLGGRRLPGMPLPDSTNGNHPRTEFTRQPQTPALGPQTPALGPQTPALGTPAPAPAPAPAKPKPNPFGNAKPVDILAKEKEYESRIININHTTVRTVGSDEQPEKEPRRLSQSKPRRPSINLLKRPANALPPPPQSPPKPTLSPAAVPPSSWGSKASGLSLADILGSQKNDSSSAVGKKVSAKNSPKPTVVKPVILKKKTPVATPQVDLTVKESDYIKQESDKKLDQEVKEKELEIEHKLKQINETLSKTESAKDEQPLPDTNGDAATKEAETKSVPEAASNSNKIPASPVKAKIDLLSNAKAHLPGDRPNFKQHFDEMTKKAASNKENRHKSGSNGSSRPSSGHRRQNNTDNGESSNGEVSGRPNSHSARDHSHPRHTHNLSKVFRRKPEERKKEVEPEAAVQSDKPEKAAKVDKAKKPEEIVKTEKPTKPGKPEKTGKPEKGEKPRRERAPRAPRVPKAEKSRSPEEPKTPSESKDEVEVSDKPASSGDEGSETSSRGGSRGRGRSRGGSRGRGSRGRGRGAARGISASKFQYIRNKTEEGTQ